MLGLKAREQSALQSVCVLSAHPSRPFSHAICGDDHQADVFVVDATDPVTVQRWSSELDLEHRAVVLIDPPEGQRISANILRRPLLASRQLAALYEIARKVQPREGASAAAFDGASVLVVDDSPTVRKHLAIILRRRGIEARLASSGEEALAEVTRHAPDLVLLDVEMPGVDGYQVCKTLKRNNKGRELPIIMLTSRASPFDRIRGSLAGCDAYLVKPVDTASFFHMLEARLKGRSAATAGGTAPAGWPAHGGQPA